MRSKYLEPSLGTGSVQVIEESAQQRLTTGLWPREGSHSTVALVSFPKIPVVIGTGIAGFLPERIHLVPVFLRDLQEGRI